MSATVLAVWMLILFIFLIYILVMCDASEDRAPNPTIIPDTALGPFGPGPGAGGKKCTEGGGAGVVGDMASFCPSITATVAVTCTASEDCTIFATNDNTNPCVGGVRFASCQGKGDDCVASRTIKVRYNTAIKAVVLAKQRRQSERIVNKYEVFAPPASLALWPKSASSNCATGVCQAGCKDPKTGVRSDNCGTWKTDTMPVLRFSLPPLFPFSVGSRIYYTLNGTEPIAKGTGRSKGKDVPTGLLYDPKNPPQIFISTTVKAAVLQTNLKVCADGNPPSGNIPGQGSCKNGVKLLRKTYKLTASTTTTWKFDITKSAPVLFTPATVKDRQYTSSAGIKKCIDQDSKALKAGLFGSNTYKYCGAFITAQKASPCTVGADKAKFNDLCCKSCGGKDQPITVWSPTDKAQECKLVGRAGNKCHVFAVTKGCFNIELATLTPGSSVKYAFAHESCMKGCTTMTNPGGPAGDGTTRGGACAEALKKCGRVYDATKGLQVFRGNANTGILAVLAYTYDVNKTVTPGDVFEAGYLLKASKPTFSPVGDETGAVIYNGGKDISLKTATPSMALKSNGDSPCDGSELLKTEETIMQSARKCVPNDPTVAYSSSKKPFLPLNCELVAYTTRVGLAKSAETRANYLVRLLPPLFATPLVPVGYKVGNSLKAKKGTRGSWTGAAVFKNVETKDAVYDDDEAGLDITISLDSTKAQSGSSVQDTSDIFITVVPLQNESPGGTPTYDVPPAVRRAKKYNTKCDTAGTCLPMDGNRNGASFSNPEYSVKEWYTGRWSMTAGGKRQFKAEIQKGKNETKCKLPGVGKSTVADMCTAGGKGACTAGICTYKAPMGREWYTIPNVDEPLKCTGASKNKGWPADKVNANELTYAGPCDPKHFFTLKCNKECKVNVRQSVLVTAYAKSSTCPQQCAEESDLSSAKYVIRLPRPCSGMAPYACGCGLGNMDTSVDSDTSTKSRGPGKCVLPAGNIPCRGGSGSPEITEVVYPLGTDTPDTEVLANGGVTTETEIWYSLSSTAHIAGRKMNHPDGDIREDLDTHLGKLSPPIRAAEFERSTWDKSAPKPIFRFTDTKFLGSFPKSTTEKCFFGQASGTSDWCHTGESKTENFDFLCPKGWTSVNKKKFSNVQYAYACEPLAVDLAKLKASTNKAFCMLNSFTPKGTAKVLFSFSRIDARAKKTYGAKCGITWPQSRTISLVGGKVLFHKMVRGNDLHLDYTTPIYSFSTKGYVGATPYGAPTSPGTLLGNPNPRLSSSVGKDICYVKVDSPIYSPVSTPQGFEYFTDSNEGPIDTTIDLLTTAQDKTDKSRDSFNEKLIMWLTSKTHDSGCSTAVYDMAKKATLGGKVNRKCNPTVHDFSNQCGQAQLTTGLASGARPSTTDIREGLNCQRPVKIYYVQNPKDMMLKDSGGNTAVQQRSKSQTFDPAGSPTKPATSGEAIVTNQPSAFAKGILKSRWTSGPEGDNDKAAVDSIVLSTPGANNGMTSVFFPRMEVKLSNSNFGSDSKLNDKRIGGSPRTTDKDYGVNTQIKGSGAVQGYYLTAVASKQGCMDSDQTQTTYVLKASAPSFTCSGWFSRAADTGIAGVRAVDSWSDFAACGGSGPGAYRLANELSHLGAPASKAVSPREGKQIDEANTLTAGTTSWKHSSWKQQQRNRDSWGQRTKAESDTYFKATADKNLWVAAVRVTMNTISDGAQIWYTTDRTNPTCSCNEKSCTLDVYGTPRHAKMNNPTWVKGGPNWAGSFVSAAGMPKGSGVHETPMDLSKTKLNIKKYQCTANHLCTMQGKDGLGNPYLPCDKAFIELRTVTVLQAQARLVCEMPELCEVSDVTSSWLRIRIGPPFINWLSAGITKPFKFKTGTQTGTNGKPENIYTQLLFRQGLAKVCSKSNELQDVDMLQLAGIQLGPPPNIFFGSGPGVKTDTSTMAINTGAQRSCTVGSFAVSYGLFAAYDVFWLRSCMTTSASKCQTDTWKAVLTGDGSSGLKFKSQELIENSPPVAVPVLILMPLAREAIAGYYIYESSKRSYGNEKKPIASFIYYQNCQVAYKKGNLGVLLMSMIVTATCGAGTPGTSSASYQTTVTGKKCGTAAGAPDEHGTCNKALILGECLQKSDKARTSKCKDFDGARYGDYGVSCDKAATGCEYFPVAGKTKGQDSGLVAILPFLGSMNPTIALNQPNRYSSFETLSWKVGKLNTGTPARPGVPVIVDYTLGFTPQDFSDGNMNGKKYKGNGQWTATSTAKTIALTTFTFDYAFMENTNNALGSKQLTHSNVGFFNDWATVKTTTGFVDHSQGKVYFKFKKPGGGYYADSEVTCFFFDNKGDYYWYEPTGKAVAGVKAAAGVKDASGKAPWEKACGADCGKCIMPLSKDLSYSVLKSQIALIGRTMDQNKRSIPSSLYDCNKGSKAAHCKVSFFVKRSDSKTTVPYLDTDGVVMTWIGVKGDTALDSNKPNELSGGDKLILFGQQQQQFPIQDSCKLTNSCLRLAHIPGVCKYDNAYLGGDAAKIKAVCPCVSTSAKCRGNERCVSGKCTCPNGRCY